MQQDFNLRALMKGEIIYLGIPPKEVSRLYIEHMPSYTLKLALYSDMKGIEKQYFETNHSLGYKPFLFNGNIYLVADGVIDAPLILHGENGYKDACFAIEAISRLQENEELGSKAVAMTIKMFHKFKPCLTETVYPYWLAEQVQTRSKDKTILGISYVNGNRSYHQNLCALDGTMYTSKEIYVRPVLMLPNKDVYVTLGSTDRDGTTREKALRIKI